MVDLLHGEHEVVEWLIASGRDLGDVKNKKGSFGGLDEKTALDIARWRSNTKVVPLLERFIANPVQTRHELRVKLGVPDALAADVFALTVFLWDDLLQPTPASIPAATPNYAASAATVVATNTRFFAMATRLPMKLQMLLCRCAVGSMKQNILLVDSEAAFKSLARLLLLSSFRMNNSRTHCDHDQCYSLNVFDSETCACLLLLLLLLSSTFLHTRVRLIASGSSKIIEDVIIGIFEYLNLNRFLLFFFSFSFSFSFLSPSSHKNLFKIFPSFQFPFAFQFLY